MSNVWRGITDNAQWIKKGASTTVGNGLQTLFWEHSWATDTPLRELATQDIPSEVEGAIVQEMWEVGSGWKWDLFANLLPEEALKKIAAHTVVEDPNIGGLLYWRGSTSGRFSIKHALTLIRNEEDSAKDPKWELAWKAPVQQRVKIFLWLALHDKLLCNANRLKRRLTEDPGCQRCNHNEETLLHLLRDCPTSRHIWQSVGGSANYPSFFTGTLTD